MVAFLVMVPHPIRWEAPQVREHWRKVLQDRRIEKRLRVQDALEKRPAFLPPISRGRKRRLLPIIPADQTLVLGWVVDGDPFCLRLRSLGLWQNALENAVLERGLDLVFVNVHADRNLPFEAAVETFTELALLVLCLGFHLAAKDQIAVVQEKFAVLWRNCHKRFSSRFPSDSERSQ